jgi:carboxyl-terminal processing protease
VVDQDGLILLFPFPGTPAENAGVEAGDVLLEIQGEPVGGKTVQEAVDQVAGPQGTKVRLLVGRSGEPEPLELDVFRGTIDLPSVSTQLAPGGIGYVYISRFLDNTGEQVFDALENLMQYDMLALILDLRTNPGGSVEAAANVAGQFVAPGSVFLHLEDRRGDRREQRIPEDLDRLELEQLSMVVLVDEATIREAEALAAVLQETGRAVLMGTGTFGSVGTYSFVELSDGSAVYLPTARWYTPEGNLLGAAGVQPDMTVLYDPQAGGIGGESQFNRAYGYLNDQLPPFR